MSTQKWRTAVAVAGVLTLVGCGEAPLEFGTPAETEPPPRQPIPSWTAPPPSSFTVAATGDVLIHPGLIDQAVADGDGDGQRDFTELLAGVQPVISAADLAICHLETPLGEPDGRFTGYPIFNVPPEVAAALAETGYDQCSTASDHTMDAGPEGVTHTLDALDAAGIGHTGSARTEEEAATPEVIELDGFTVGHVSFTLGNNRNQDNAPSWMVNRLDAAAVLDAAGQAKEAGADVVIASLHWGGEFVPDPTPQQERLAAELLADPAVDLIIGHHAHMVQPLEQIGDKWVAYGLGNHVARHANPLGTTEEGIIAQFRFTRTSQDNWTVAYVDYVPTLTDVGPPVRLVDLNEADGNQRRDLAASRIDEAVRSRGAELGPITR